LLLDKLGNVDLFDKSKELEEGKGIGRRNTILNI
jgi:hypothetical protein